MDSKTDIRKRVLEARKHVTIKEWEEKTHVIFQKVVTHPFFLEADTIYCYIDYKNEVGTREIIKRTWEAGKKVAVPKVEGESMTFYYLHSFEELQTGYRNILEPTSKQTASEEKGLMLLPGVAFDKYRNRIGYGKGFYDRYLSQHPNLNTIALAFELQVVETFPTEATDYHPEILITEENIYV